MKQTTTSALLAAIALSLLIPAQAAAFCGFYVAGADQKMFNNATQVVMMREGTKTVLSMQNNYQGPPTDFAMVVPVPVVLKKDNVKVLKDATFAKIDQLAAPRLVEYFEQDPCYVEPPSPDYDEEGAVDAVKSAPPPPTPSPDLGVKIEAQFDVGEYNVVVLSAKESNGLETWLAQEKYNIPKGAAPALKPYIEQGLYFFVAKVDPKKVTFKDGQATLSPLRFHYDSKDFFLPVRLGLLNAKGAQDLIVHILARNTRYEVANFKNVTIPTNLIVKQDVRKSFAEFYVSLFDYTLKENPGSVVTEYSWDASTCDPCPGPALNQSDITTFGGDIAAPQHLSPWSGWVLTRLHARYTAAQLKDDLVFKAASPIVGGRGTPSGPEAKMAEEGTKPGGRNNFQGRYIMLNPWEGKIACDKPIRGRWGGPPPGKTSKPTAAEDTAFAPRGSFKLAPAVHGASIPGLKLKPEAGVINVIAKAAPAPDEDKTAPKPADPNKQDKKNSCAAAPTDAPGSPIGALVMLAIGALLRRRHKEVA